MLIGHLSDLHVLDLHGVRPWHFANKRITGGLNLLIGRARTHQIELLEGALTKLGELGCDHIAITGDFTNLALDSEFARARALLDAAVPGSMLSVVPGNHDRYTLRAALSRRFEHYFGDLLQTDLPRLPSVGGWPYVRLFDELAIVGVNSAVAQPWMVSGGRVGAKQRAALAAALRNAEVRNRFVVVLIHHHLFKPPHKRREFPRGLFDRAQVIETLLEGGTDLVLHGHNHYYGLYRVPSATNGGGSMLVSEAGSTTVSDASEDVKRGKFNTYEIVGGELVAIRTYIYRRGEGFVPWRTWNLASDDIPIVTP